MSGAGLRVLLTGGTGVIGAWAARELADAGHEVMSVTRGQSTVGRPILGDRPIRETRLDLTDADAVRACVREHRPDVIAHLASAKPWQMDAGYVEDPDPPLGVRTIIDGTTNILEAARREGVGRVVYASSKSAYAAFTGEHAFPEYRPVSEDYPSIPTEIYGITKLAAEHLGSYYKRHLGVDFIALRFGSTYGPFKRGAGISPAGLIARAIDGEATAASYSKRVYFEERDEFVYNRDIGRAIRVACEAAPTASDVFNIGTGVGSSIADVVEAIRSIPGMPSLEVTVTDDAVEGQGGHLVKNVAGVLDPSRAREELGFEAQFGLREGIADAARIVAEAGESGDVR